MLNKKNILIVIFIAIAMYFVLSFNDHNFKRAVDACLAGSQKLSESKITDDKTEMFEQVKKELGFSSEKISILAKTRLNLLLHNYSFFQIETLDGFNHHIIRSFYKELNLEPDFRVVQLYLNLRPQ